MLPPLTAATQHEFSSDRTLSFVTELERNVRVGFGWLGMTVCFSVTAGEGGEIQHCGPAGEHSV